MASGYEAVCNGFFTVIAGKSLQQSPITKGTKSECIYFKEPFNERLSLLSSQMCSMNTSATIFTTSPCNFSNYPCVQTIRFNPRKLLTEYGLESIRPKIESWQYQVVEIRHAYTRIADILRVLLAEK